MSVQVIVDQRDMNKLVIVNGTYDEALRDCFKINKNSAISWWISASFAYYLRYESLFSDPVFDKLSKWILENYDELEHQHKHLVTKEGLKAGSGYYLKEDDYPLRVKVATETLIRDLLIWRNEKGENQK